eukprot:3725579-Pleurochrysis_carterae.AAC.3
MIPIRLQRLVHLQKVSVWLESSDTARQQALALLCAQPGRASNALDVTDLTDEAKEWLTAVSFQDQRTWSSCGSSACTQYSENGILKGGPNHGTALEDSIYLPCCSSARTVSTYRAARQLSIYCTYSPANYM